MIHHLQQLNCFLTQNQKDEMKRNYKINRDIQKDKKISKTEFKVLLLGGGETGKSTFVKQMKIIHGDGYSNEDKQAFKQAVYQNVFMAIQALIQAMDLLCITYETNESIEYADMIRKLNFQTIVTFEEPYITAVKTIWADAGIQKCYSRRREFYITDSAKYYFSDIDRISKTNYIPTQQDILRARKATVGIQEYKIFLDKSSFKIVDVGGQKSERRKWIHCFDNITSIIFFSAISEYDQVLYESPTENRLADSLDLFRNVLTYPWFEKSSIILFLNKKDIFSEKILNSHLEEFFPEYDGPKRDDMKAREFILDLFLESAVSQKTIYWHFTCATDTDNIQFVFKAVTDKILQHNLESLNLI